MTVRIRLDHGQGAGRIWRLAKEGVYTIGRTPASTLQVLDMKVSKDQGTITVVGSGDEARTFLRDLESRHGTLLNGQPVATKVKLKPGDEIRLGLSILRVLSDGEADVECEPASTAGGAPAVPTQDQAAGTPQKKRKTFAPDQLVGQEVGGYKVKEKIGQGGMGSVYVAEQLSLHREVAFKVLNEKLTSDANFVDQFVNEARSAAALNHPNVVQVYDVGRESGRYYFSMEFVAGGSLEEKLAEDGPADWREGLNWFIDSSNALIFAQRREILHRDVKPDNLMLAEDGSAKLCDLGLAKKAANDDMLAAGIIGTPAFISPEAIRRKKDINVRSDLYSLGCTFYRLLVGENPYPGKTVKDILLGHLNKPVPRVSAKKPDIPRDLDDVIFTLMQKDPDDRYQTPQDLLDALDKIRVQHGLERHGLRPGSRKPLLIALAAVVVLGVAAIAFLATRKPEVVVPTRTPQQIAEDKRRKEEAEANAFKAFTGGARSEYLTVKAEEAGGNLRFADNAFDIKWPRIIGDYRKLAERLTADEKYGSRPEVVEIADTAKSAAANIERYVKLRTETRNVIEESRRTAVQELESALSKQRQTFDEAVEAKAWVKAAAAAEPDAIDRFVQPLADQKVKDILPGQVPAETKKMFGDDLLLDPEQHVLPLLEKYAPGDPPGQALLDQVLEQARSIHTRALSDGASLAELGTHEALQKAVEALDKYLEGLPDGSGLGEGALAQEIARFRSETEAAVSALRERSEALVFNDIRHDRKAFYMALKALRAPRGFLSRFRFDDALRTAETSAKAMRYAGYQELAAEIVDDVKALERLMGRLIETYPDGWTKDKIEVLDERGKEDTERVRGMAKTGVTYGGMERSFATLGPAWLLEQLFYASPDEPRFTFEGEDFRGLAVLAELAIDYDRAAKYYQRYLRTLDPARTRTQNQMRRRLAAMPRERAVAEAWKLAFGNKRGVEAFLDEHDPALLDDPEEFWQKDTHRQAITGSGKSLSEQMMLAYEALATLEDAKYADTLWAAILADKMPAKAQWAGEPALPEKAPEKDPEKAPEDDAPPPPPPPAPPADKPEAPGDN